MEIKLNHDGRLRLTLPTSHEVLIPASEAGLRCLVQLIQEYDRGETKIATKGALTQWQLNEMLKAYEAAKPKLKLDVEIEL